MFEFPGLESNFSYTSFPLTPQHEIDGIIYTEIILLLSRRNAACHFTKLKCADIAVASLSIVD